MKKFYFFIFVFAAFIALNGCFNGLPPELAGFSDDLPDRVDFNFHIKPIFSDRCFKCHGPDALQRKGDLRLDVPSDAFKKVLNPKGAATNILKSKSLAQSEVFHRIMSANGEYMMPPPESNLSLSEREKALIAKWILQGATYKKHWSFESPQMPEIPKYKDEWVTNEIDQFILAGLQPLNLSPSEKASKTTLLRRATLDITGLPPTYEEIDDFINDESEDAYDKALDRLLGSPHYGERMALDWLDVARYADSHGYQDDGMRTTWPWRDWVIKAFNENLHYDDFLIWQLAGDLLENPTKDQLLATCFNRNHPQTQEGGVVDEEYRAEYVADRTNTFGKSFLGLTTECARCHDHKYDPITQEDYYSLYAYFNNNNESGIVPYNGEASPTVFLPTPEAEQKLDSLGMVIDSLSQFLVSDRYIEDFKEWYEKQDQVIVPENSYKLLADFSFEQEVEGNDKIMNLNRLSPDKLKGNGKNVKGYINKAKNRPDAMVQGDTDRRPVSSKGKVGNGVKFRGDAGIRFNRDLDIDRNQPFSVSIWIKPLKEDLAGPIFNNTNGEFEGYRGWLCKLNEDGTLSFQFNHVWPDNAIDIKTDKKIPVGEWTHVAMVYDGTSTAEGVQFYINGEVPTHTILKDKLYKSLLHGKNGSNWTNLPFMLGMEFTKTIEDLEMDELKIYKRQLSIPEVKALYQLNNSFRLSETDNGELLEHYLYSGYNDDYNKNAQLISEVRKVENLTATDEIEVMIMQERPFARPTYILDRGMYDQPTKEVHAHVPSFFPEITAKNPEDRLELAQWLVNKDHPLTARVAVNRLWKIFFGTGIVSTQEDFGSQGNLPSHPELLDWLALKLVDLDWDVKAFIKIIMTSSTYTQSSIGSELAKSEDPENRYYSHFPAHRLSAETIRDNALAASGLLVKKIGGPSVYPYQPPGLWEALATRNATTYKVQSGDSLYRRSMYTIWKRSSPPPSMMTFDAPDRYYCVVNRQKTSTPLQSLVLMNDIQFLEASRVLGAKMMLQSKSDPITYAFTSLIGRPPDSHELKVLTDQYDQALKELKDQPNNVQAWLSSGEYEIHPGDKIERAASTMVASTIMNFDEFVMKR